MSTAISLSQAIQSWLTPAVMISSTALFFMGLNARQSAVFARIRSLNDEKRKLIFTAQNTPNQVHYHRCLNIEQQINGLLRRVWYIRNSIICYMMAVIFLVLTSFFIGFNLFFSTGISYAIPLGLFILGMSLVLIGSFCLVCDEWLSYSIILMEIKENT